MIKIAYSTEGKPQMISFLFRDSYLQIPFDPESKTINWRQKDEEIKQSFESWVADGGILDLSDRPPTPQIPQPDWKQFRRGMWPDAGFKRLTKDTTDRESKEDLKIAAAVSTDDYVWLKVLWGKCVDGLTTKPTAIEIDSWKAIASGAAMPLSFGTDGKMVLL